MKTLTVTTDKGKERIPFPESWSEVSTDTYQKIYSTEELDLIGLFSVLSGMPYKVIANQRNIDMENAIMGAVGFVMDSKLVYKEENVPIYIEIGGKKILIPRDLGSLTFGQNVHLRQKVEQLGETGKLNTLISYAVTIYLQPLVDGTEFDMARFDDLHKEVLKLPITETYEVGFFFLNQLTSSGTTSKPLIGRTLQNIWKSFIRPVKQMVFKLRLKGWLDLSI